MIYFHVKEPIEIKAGQMVELVIIDGALTVRPVFTEDALELALRSLRPSQNRPEG